MFRVTILEPFVKNLKAGRFPAVIRIQAGQKETDRLPPVVHLSLASLGYIPNSCLKQVVK